MSSTEPQENFPPHLDDLGHVSTTRSQADPDTTHKMLSIASFTTAYAPAIRMSSNPDAPIKLGVNGFGRIGRQVVRIAMDRDSFILKHINSPMAPEYMKYLLEHDTVHGRFSGTCELAGEGLKINGVDVSLSATRDPTEIPWKDVRALRLLPLSPAHAYSCQRAALCGELQLLMLSLIHI